jgi:dTDP-4-amino-4,6-dideoxygalactose transaminase
MKVPLFDMTRIIKPCRNELVKVFDDSLDHCKFINGDLVDSLENDMQDYLGVENFIGVSSGTDALLSIFISLGLEPGDEILVTPFTFIASATSILRAGLKPVFVDVSEDGFLPTIDNYQEALTPRTRGILAVHLFGEPNDMSALSRFCEDNYLMLIEDCAQSFGSSWENKHTGTYGVASAFSFFPAKNLGCFGDGGGIATNDKIVAGNIQSIKSHGNSKFLGGNFRLDSLQASILSVLLPKVSQWNIKRRENAFAYQSNLDDIGGLLLPSDVEGHSWNQYTVRSGERDELKEYLKDCGIETAIYYNKPLHKHELFNTDKPLKNAEKRCKEVLSLPVYPGLAFEERSYIIESILKFYGA